MIVLHRFDSVECFMNDLHRRRQGGSREDVQKAMLVVAQRLFPAVPQVVSQAAAVMELLHSKLSGKLSKEDGAATMLSKLYQASPAVCKTSLKMLAQRASSRRLVSYVRILFAITTSSYDACATSHVCVMHSPSVDVEVSLQAWIYMFHGENICGEKWGPQGSGTELSCGTLHCVRSVRMWYWRCRQAIPLLKADLNDTGDVAVSAMLTTIEEVCNLCELSGHIGHSCIVRLAMLVPISLILCTSGYTNITKDCELARTTSRASRNHRRVPVYTCYSIRFEQLQMIHNLYLINCFHFSVAVY